MSTTLTYALLPEHKAFIRREQMICAVLAGLLPAVVMWFLSGPFPMPLEGRTGFAVFLAKNTFGMVTVMTLLMTLGARAQIAKGAAPRLDWRQAGHPLARVTPTRILLRAPLYGLAALIVLAPISLLVIRLSGFSLLDRPAFVIINLIFGSAVGFIMTPLILIGALNDPPPARRLGV